MKKDTERKKEFSPEYLAFIERFWIYVESLGIYQSNLADKWGLNNSEMTHYKNKTRGMSMEKFLQVMLKEDDFPLKYIMYGEGEEPIKKIPGKKGDPIKKLEEKIDDMNQRLELAEKEIKKLKKTRK